MQYTSINPTTEQLIRSYPLSTGQDIQTALQQAQAAFAAWKDLSVYKRAAPMMKLARLLETRAEELSVQMAVEMGKPRKEGVGESKKCAWVCSHYGLEAAEMLHPVPHTSDGLEVFVRHDPLGAVLAIMPWNFPYWQVFRFAVPTLMAGNVVLLKHAPNTPEAAERITQMMREAGFPEGVFQNLRMTEEQVASVIADPRVAGVTLTGSTRAGQAVAQLAGKHLKPAVMELGGSDPFIVFDDADLDKALDAAIVSRCLNNGQSCIAAKRFLLHQPVAAEFTERLKVRMQQMKVGDPLDPDVQVGPLARADLREHLADQVQRSLHAGAKLVYQGTTPHQGYFYPPTILSGISPENPAAQEEFFGPVALIMPFADEAEAVSLANATSYGLGASLWTRSLARIYRMNPQIEAGNVFANGMVKSDPRIPFGGIKMSGFGRELGREGLLAFTNTKTVWIAD